MLIWLTTIVAFGVVLAMIAIANERKERTLQFVLSLPLSHGDYVRIKVIGLLLCFLVPWFVLERRRGHARRGDAQSARRNVAVSPCCCAGSCWPTTRWCCAARCIPPPRDS